MSLSLCVTLVLPISCLRLVVENIAAMRWGQAVHFPVGNGEFRIEDECDEDWALGPRSSARQHSEEGKGREGIRSRRTVEEETSEYESYLDPTSEPSDGQPAAQPDR